MKERRISRGHLRYVLLWWRAQFRYLTDESCGLILLAVGLIGLLLSVPGLLPGSNVPWLWVLVGWGTPVVVLSLIAGGAAIIFARRFGWKVRWWAVASGELFFLSLLLLIQVATKGNLQTALAGEGVGLVGWALGRLLGFIGGVWLAWGVGALLLLASLWLLLRTLPPGWTTWQAPLAALVIRVLGNLRPSALPEDAAAAPPAAPEALSANVPVFGEPAGAFAARPGRTRKPAAPAKTTRAKAQPQASEPEPPPPEPPRPARSGARPARRKPRSDAWPSMDLLKPDDNVRSGVTADTRQRGQTLKQTLLEFGVPVEVVSIKEGPTVTQYGLEPGEIVRELRSGEVLRRRVSVAMIMRLSNDLALALAAPSIRIEAPVPGRPYVGIEVPNAAKTLVPLRGLLESKEFSKIHSPLAIALGRDVSGDPVLADLTRMPHLLIAGATGSGKSVCVNALICSLLMNNGPETVRLLMIDPKMVELPGYNGIPHLLAPVVTDPSQATGALAWLTLQMDDRYRAFAAEGVRNIDEYNSKQTKARTGEPLPYTVLVMDELADLMMTAADDVERQLCRLAQMARATGIHLVLATQRPSVDVITGLIKANFPARIAFAVTSQTDSRVILDSPGAEKLLGRGDMLFMAPDSSKLARIQGCFVADDEIERIVEFWKATRPADEVQSAALPWAGLLEQMEAHDDLIEKALQLLRTKRQVSTSLLQRQLRLGYPRAARLMEQLEEMGAVGPDEGGGRSREVLLQPDGQTAGRPDA